MRSHESFGSLCDDRQLIACNDLLNARLPLLHERHSKKERAFVRRESLRNSSLEIKTMSFRDDSSVDRTDAGRIKVGEMRR
jgi:hypothetical protein